MLCRSRADPHAERLKQLRQDPGLSDAAAEYCAETIAMLPESHIAHIEQPPMVDGAAARLLNSWMPGSLQHHKPVSDVRCHVVVSKMLLYMHSMYDRSRKLGVCCIASPEQS